MSLILSATLFVLLPAFQSHDHDAMKRRGSAAMGFDQDKTVHQFTATTSGGFIDIAVRDPLDKANLDSIRKHLKHISEKFKQGDFDIPAFIHAELPPGAETMKSFKASIRYEFKVTDRGARLIISTGNAEALRGIHDFLKYQGDAHLN